VLSSNMCSTDIYKISDSSCSISQNQKQNNIVLKSAHIMGKKNVLADQLSRVKVQPTEWSLDKSVVQQIFQVWGASLIDLFASWENRLTRNLLYVDSSSQMI